MHRADAPGRHPDPEPLVKKNNGVNRAVLEALKGKSILSARQFDRETMLELFRLAAFLESTEITSHRPLAGKIVTTAFFEASTRTRLSFESAVLRLDGKVLSVPDARQTGTAKGESLMDIGEMFNAYADLVVMRHTETNSVDQLMRYMRVPLINAGNGSGEHPTQALADWYALLKWNPALAEPEKLKKPVRLGILGTPGNMRAVKSFLYLALQFKGAVESLTVVSEMADPFGEDVQKVVDLSGLKVSVVNDIDEVIQGLDVVYMNSIALLGDSYQNLDSRFKIDKDTPLKDGAVILHPLARNDELSPAIDPTPHNLYFNAAAGAVYLRQALLLCLLNRLSHLPETAWA